MAVWALADLHLPFSDPKKDMAIFGPDWENYTERIETNWNRLVGDEDLVLVAGDISWAMRPEEAGKDLEWIDALPGTKLICRGNHDYWWSSASKVAKILPPSIKFVHHSVFDWNELSIAGTRFWDSEEYSFLKYMPILENSMPKKIEFSEKIFEKELGRLEMALKNLNTKAKWRIAMTHYPLIGADLADSRASKLLENYEVQIAIFGHLHSIDKKAKLFGEKNGVRYILTSCDYLDCRPLRIL